MTTRVQAKARTRQRYLSEASRLFATRGFHAVSIEALGEAVGVSGPALYRHFASKEAMLAEILTSASSALLAGLEQILARGGLEGQELLEALIESHLDFAMSSRDVIRLQDRELDTLPAETNRQVRRMQREYLDGWARVVARLRGDLSLPEIRVLMHAVFGILNSTAHNEALAPEPVTREVLARAARQALGMRAR